MLGKGMIGDCIAYKNEGGKLIFVRQMFQGKTNADVTFKAPHRGSLRSRPERFAPISSSPTHPAKRPSTQ